MEIKRINPSKETGHISKQRRDDPHHKREQPNTKTRPTFKQILDNEIKKDSEENER